MKVLLTARSCTACSILMVPVTLGLFILFRPLVVKAEAAHSWTRFLVNADQLKDRPGIPFVIAYTDYSDYTLSAAAWYRYTQGRDPVILHGKWEPDGLFRPAAAYEVAMEDKTKWKKLPAEAQSESDSLTVSPENPLVRLTMSMEPFRSCIGIYRYGRVVLENGDVAIVELEDLLPTANARGQSGDFREDVFGGDLKMRQQGFKDPEPNNPAHLRSVTSLGGRLIGDFIFVPRSENSAVIEGTRKLDGGFWPKVTLQVGNSDHHWETIGKSKDDGAPLRLELSAERSETIRVLLSDYKPLIGKYKYGRIVFSNGESGVFYLDLLNPRS